MRSPALKFILLFIAQTALWNYFNFTPYVFIVFLPAMLLCLPAERGTVRVMILAFILGLIADFLVNGQMGLTSLALVPVAAFRRRVIRIVFGQEFFIRDEALSFHRQGWVKFLWAILLLTGIYLIVYIPVDCAGMYSSGFRTLKFLLSLLASSAVSMAAAFLLLEESDERWK